MRASAKLDCPPQNIFKRETMADLLERLKQRGEQTDEEWHTSLANLVKEFRDQNYFQLFGLTPASTVETKKLKKTYNQLCKRLHPDRNMTKCYKDECEKLFTLVSVAYATLSDPDKLKEYCRPFFAKRKRDPQPTSHRRPPPPAYVNSQTFVFFSGLPVEPKVYSRDIARGERINNLWGNITINGNVYGDVSTSVGHITVNGHVFGNVTSATGFIIINGSVSGQVSTGTGNISVIKNVCNDGRVSSGTGNINVGRVGRTGTVTTNLGRVIVEGECEGAANSNCGQVKIDGAVVKENSAASASSSFYFRL